MHCLASGWTPWRGALAASLTLALFACGGGSGSGVASGGGGSVEPPVPPPIASAGVYLRAGALSGLSYADASGVNARFFKPGAMTVDSLGNIWVEDVDPRVDALTYSGAETTLRAIDSNGAVKTIGWGVRSQIQPNTSYLGLIADGYGNVHQRYRVGSEIGGPTYWVGTAFSTLSNPTAAPDMPQARNCVPDYYGNMLGMDKRGALYCLEQLPGDGAGISLVKHSANETTLIPQVRANGDTEQTFFRLPQFSFDAVGNAFFLDSAQFSGHGGGGASYTGVRKLIPSLGYATVLWTQAGSPDYVDGDSGVAFMKAPQDLQLDGAGNMYFRDNKSSGDYIRKLTPAGTMTTVAGPLGGNKNFAVTPNGEVVRFEGLQLVAYDANGGKRAVAGSPVETQGNGNGTAAQARFNGPTGVTVDNNANIYVADSNNNLVRKIDTAGNVSTLASVSGPRGIVFDGQRSLYVTGDSRELIKVDVQTGIVTAVPGSNGLSASALAVDASGKIYTNDWGNLALRVYDPKASGLAFLAQGAFKYASSASPGFRGLAVDSSGNVYLMDPQDAKLRKVSPSGAVSKLPGAAGETVFSVTAGIAVDKVGNLYVTDTDRHVIKKITPDGIVSTVAGSSTVSYAAAGALPASLGFPQGIAVRQVGTSTELVVTDQNAVLSITLD
jgi:streptogramin lyase